MSNDISSSAGVPKQLPAWNTRTNAGSQAANSIADDSWFEAMAQAWGAALDKQAEKIVDLAESMSDAGGPGDAGGKDTPSVVTMLTAEAQKMSFLSQSAASATNAVGHALETIGRKQ